MSKKSGWIKFTIKNNSSVASEQIVDIPANYYLDEVVLYPPDSDPIFRGDHYPGSDLLSYGHTFRLDVKPGSHTYYLSLKGKDYINISLLLYDNTIDYLKEKIAETGFLLIFLTMTTTMVLYSSFLLYAFREIKYLYYLIYHLLSIYSYFYRAGFFQNFMKDPLVILNDSWAFITHLHLFFAFIFIMEFLSVFVKKHAILRQITRFLYYIFPISSLLYIVDYEYGALATLVLVFVACAAAATAITLSLLENKLEYYFFAIGWLILIYASTWYATSYIGLAKSTFLSSNMLIAASGIESITAGLAIGLQVHRIRYQKIFGFKQLRRLVFPHQTQMISDGVDLLKTMPSGSGNAFIMAFDIEKSSRILHARKKLFLESVIENCQNLMTENYESTKMTANAYSIKGVGDGFLCSIGYPFGSPNGPHEADHAISLAHQFIKIFNQAVKDLDYTEEIYCSIGISHGAVEGYFTKGKVVQYDLYGHAIVTATRYESLRKELYPQGLPSNLITIQTTVYRSLSAPQRAQFEAVDLGERGFTVRDDPGADKVYVCEVSRAPLAIDSVAA